MDYHGLSINLNFPQHTYPAAQGSSDCGKHKHILHQITIQCKRVVVFRLAMVQLALRNGRLTTHPQWQWNILWQKMAIIQTDTITVQVVRLWKTLESNVIGTTLHIKLTNLNEPDAVCHMFGQCKQKHKSAFNKDVYHCSNLLTIPDIVRAQSTTDSGKRKAIWQTNACKILQGTRQHPSGRGHRLLCHCYQ